MGAIAVAAMALYTDSQTDFQYILFQRSGGVIGCIGIVVAVLKFRHWRLGGNETVADRIFRALGQPTPIERAVRKFEFQKAASAVALGLLGTLIATFGDVARIVLMPAPVMEAPVKSESPPRQAVAARNPSRVPDGSQGREHVNSISSAPITNASGSGR